MWIPNVWFANGGAGLALLLLLAPVAQARDCEVAADAVNEAAELFKRAGRQTTLEDGRREARRLQRAIDDAAVEASDCDCEQSASKLDAAGARVRRARVADTRREFADQLIQAVDEFNIGVAHMEICVVN
jgi:succinate dehydrogenase/fumarate reductase flavoprotein subunit